MKDEIETEIETGGGKKEFMENIKKAIHAFNGTLNNIIDQNQNQDQDQDKSVATENHINDDVEDNVLSSDIGNDKLDDKVDGAVTSVFGMFKAMMKDMDKYKDKPYLGTTIMTNFFKILSAYGDNPDLSGGNSMSNEYVEIVQVVGENAKKVCEMLKDSSVEDLREVPEFKEYVLNTTIGYNKLMIFSLKKTTEKMEEDLSKINNEMPIDTLLENIYISVSKTLKK